MIAKHRHTELTSFHISKKRIRTRRVLAGHFEKVEGFLRTRCFTERMDDDQLRQKLASWEVRPEIPPDFQRNVWQKIAVRESKWKMLSFGNWNHWWLRTPRLATCAIILGSFVGTGLGLDPLDTG